MNQMSRNQAILRKAIFEVSESDIWEEALKEFDYSRDYITREDNCTCSHRINQVYEIIHKTSGVVFNIGNKCIEHFENAPFYSVLKSAEELNNRSKRAKIPVGRFKGMTFNHIYTHEHRYVRKLRQVLASGSELHYGLHRFVNFCDRQDKIKAFKTKISKK